MLSLLKAGVVGWIRWECADGLDRIDTDERGDTHRGAHSADQRQGLGHAGGGHVDREQRGHPLGGYAAPGSYTVAIARCRSADAVVAIRGPFAYAVAGGDALDGADRQPIGGGHLVRRIQPVQLGDLLLALQRDTGEVKPAQPRRHCGGRAAFDACRVQKMADHGLGSAELDRQLIEGRAIAVPSRDPPCHELRWFGRVRVLVGGVGHALASVAPRECAVRVADDTRQESAPEQ